jgi:hypothetical protein
LSTADVLSPLGTDQTADIQPDIVDGPSWPNSARDRTVVGKPLRFPWLSATAGKFNSRR